MADKDTTIDTIHGQIEIPQWLVKIKDEPVIHRMMRIKQLGLKAFIDFTNANHTRYSHSLGTMFLASKLADLMIKKENSRVTRRTRLKANLEYNKNSLMAAGFFHDVGHGPFSHVLDFVLEREIKRDHEWIATEVVKRFSKELEGDSIPISQVNNIIAKGKDHYPYLRGIINGPLDVDKVDYLLRDSYNVGLRYSFDLNHFLDQIAILGEGDELEKFELGLTNSPQAIVSTELFLLLWKSMYTLVYLIQSSRIAEKMLEKAILTAIRDGTSIQDDIKDLDKYIELDESVLLNKLKTSEGFPKEIYQRIFEKPDLYVAVFESDLNLFKTTPEFLKALHKSQDNVSDTISQQLSQLEPRKPYSIICDVISAKNPKEIYIDAKDEHGEPIEVKQKSSVIRALTQPEVILKIYLHPELVKTTRFVKDKGKSIKTEAQRIIEDW
jgi:HD superfamily phosphohydrolase